MAFKIKWHDDLQVILNKYSWQHVFKICFKTLNDPYLKWFQYRIIHRILGTQKLLHKMGISDSSKCLVCNSNEETLMHLFYFCPKSKQLWHQLENQIFNKAGFNVKFTPENILLGYKYNNPNSIAINTIILITKNYLFTNSRKAIEINIADLVSRIKTVYEEQVLVAYLESDGGKYEKKMVSTKKHLVYLFT